jgi:hypothetical protein
MKITASSRTLVVGLALAGSVGLGGALAASAATGTTGSSTGTVSLAGQGLDSPQDTTAGTTTASTTTRRASAVSLVEASRIAALVGHGHVTKADQEATSTGLAYEVTVVQPDGTERTVTVDRSTGRVLANTLEDASDGHDAADRPDAAGDHQEGDQTRSEAGDQAQ